MHRFWRFWYDHSPIVGRKAYNEVIKIKNRRVMEADLYRDAMVRITFMLDDLNEELVHLDKKLRKVGP